MTDEIKIISTASECSVRMFKQCAFGKDLKALIISGQPTDEILQEAWLKIYTEFVDLSGMIQTQEFELMKTIFYLDCRVKKIQLLIHIQNESMSKIGVPCVGAFDKIKLYGHKLIWDPSYPDIEGFKKRLIDIESRERRYEIELAAKIKELLNLKKNQQNQELPEIQKRKQFIRTLNNLGKTGYRIDDDKTTVEDLALMIADSNEAAEKEQYSHNNR